MRLAALALVAVLLPAQSQPVQAFPIESHCGTESGGTSVEGFVDHEELGRILERIERTSQGRVSVEVAGHSFHGREIWAARVGHGDKVVLVQSEIHGNEKHGTRALLNLLATIGNSSQRSAKIREQITFVAIPKMNPDGAELDQRRNDMSWADVVSLHPQLAGAPRAWYHSIGLNGFDVNRDFNPDLEYEPDPADLPGSSAGVGFYITPRRGPCATCTQRSKRSSASSMCSSTCTTRRRATATGYPTRLRSTSRPRPPARTRPQARRSGLRRPAAGSPATSPWSTTAAPLPASGIVRSDDYYSPLSISARFIADPAAHGDWPNFDFDASRRANLAVHDALQQGNSPFGKVTLYPQNINLPGTALGSFALRGSAVVLFETSGQTQHIGQKRIGMLTRQVEVGLTGIVDALTDGTFDDIDPERYDDIPLRLAAPTN